jgi:hypothetical protein
LAFTARYSRERAVPVEVVVGDVQQHRDLRGERGRRRVELERRHLDDDDVDGSSTHLEQRAADVAGRDRHGCRRPRGSPR